MSEKVYNGNKKALTKQNDCDILMYHKKTVSQLFRHYYSEKGIGTEFPGMIDEEQAPRRDHRRNGHGRAEIHHAASRPPLF